jgi:hypothetical protein
MVSVCVCVSRFNCFTHNIIAGALLLLCDVKEYRDCLCRFRVPLVTQLMDTLHSLCVLLTVPPENLSETTGADMLVRFV